MQPFLLLLLLLLAVSGQRPVSAPALSREDGDGASGRGATARQPLAHLPLAFIENRGQIDDRVRFQARLGDVTSFFTEQAFVFHLAPREPQCRELDTRAIKSRVRSNALASGVNVCLTFEGASDLAWLEGLEPLPGRYHYFLGNDPAKWRTDIESFGRIRYHDLYPGIEIDVREGDAGLEYDVLLAPGADLDQVVVRCEGAQSLSVDDHGGLIVQTAAGSIVQPKPVASQIAPNGDGLPVECSFRLLGDDRFGLHAPGHETALPLIVDPGLVFATLLGGSSYDSADALAVDASGAIMVAGYTESTDFPATPGAYDTVLGGSTDAFVAKLDASGSALVWATFLGGSAIDYVQSQALAVDPTGGVVVSGVTYSANFPTTPGAYDTTLDGPTDAFVAKLDAAGGALVWSTFLGGSGIDEVLSLAVDAAGAAVVCGYTYASNFPTTAGAYDTTFNGAPDAFVTKLNAGGTALAWSTFLGGSSDDGAVALTLDASGIVVAGETYSANFPTTPGAYDTTLDGPTDAFVAKLNTTGSALLWSTFLGGDDDEVAIALAKDPSGAVVVAGWADSDDFPTTPGAYDTTVNGEYDAFVAKLAPDSGNVLWSTFLGGLLNDFAYAVAVDASGAVTVTGWTASFDFPTLPNGYDSTYNDGYDAFITKLTASGNAIVQSTFLGSSGTDFGYALALDAAGAAIVAGVTSAADFPTTPGAYDTSFNGNQDAFVAKLVLATCSGDASWTNYGSGWPGTNGIPSFVSASDPVPCTTITLNLANSLGTTTTAAVLIGLTPADQPTVFGGHLLLVPITTILLSLPGSGAGLTGLLPCDGSLCGLAVLLQALEIDAGAAKGVSFTPGLELVLGS
jgi:hypothetical protein